MDWVVWLAPQNWLINYCQRVKQQKGTIDHAVIRLSDKVAVKYGPFVTPGEFATQKYAYQHTDPSIVRVPRVYRYFQNRSDPTWPAVGYLFMEYIPGQSLEDSNLSSDDEDVAKRLADIVTHLQDNRGANGLAPGPVGGGIPRGYLWGDDGAKTTFHSVKDVNDWLNKRLKLIDKSIDLTPYPLVLCHLDLCRRNIILMEDNSICVLDWGHAGLYPRFFEATAISCYNDDHLYGKGLLQAVSDAMVLKDEEQHCMKLLMRARAASLRYIFEPDDNVAAPINVLSLPPPPPLHT